MAEANGDPHTNPHGPHISYHAGPGTTHEVGVMLGFMAVFVLSMTVYLLIWRSQSASFRPPRLLILDSRKANMRCSCLQTLGKKGIGQTCSYNTAEAKCYC